MATSGRKDARRIGAFQQLEEAWKLLEQAAKKGQKAARALQLIEEAEKKVQSTSVVSVPTTFKAEETGTGKPKTLRDGLPADIRRAIEREAAHLKKLAARVKAVPITEDERILTQVNRRRERERVLTARRP